MITDNQTTKVYFSGYTEKYLQAFTKEITNLLTKYHIEFAFLKSTKDYYCRDYMPVQVTKDKFVQFIFNPKSYFTSKQIPFISNPIRIQIENKLPQPIYSRLILDGGNVVKGKTKVIITDKVISDNIYQMTEQEIINELEALLEAEVIIIPALKGDATGHADGMIRFIDDNTVLINKLGFEDEEGWDERFRAVLKKHRLKYKELPVFEGEKNTAIGLYINYLSVGKLIIAPAFQQMEQENRDVIIKMKEYFPDCIIESVDATYLAKEGGVLNCASWNILFNE
jgi:agmatine deiminase